MPPKTPTKDRTWGTRYDSLGPCTSPSSDTISPAQQSGLQVAQAAPSSSASFNAPELGTYVAQLPPSKSERYPHHASIFVGSLPSNIEHTELSHLLQNHLSAYASMRSVKVVRDTKGGVCAFIQCESPDSASSLFQLFRSQPPPPFLGRSLRFEPARAFRTLLISFRTLPATNQAKDGADPQQGVAELTSRDLPSSLRVTRSRNPKYISILYDDDARHFVAESSPQVDSKHTKPGDAFAGGGLYFPALEYDQGLIRKLAEAFGPLESFTHFDSHENGEGASVDEDPKRVYALQTAYSTSDPNTWEVKWEHRDDCVAALAVFRRISFFNVTWAHHTNSPIQGNILESQFDTPVSSPKVTPFPTPTRGRNYVPMNPTSTHRSVIVDGQPVQNQRDAPPATYLPSSVGRPDLLPATEKWSFPHRTPPLKAPLPSRGPLFSSPARNEDKVVGPRWTDIDFPPLPCEPDFGGSDLATQGNQVQEALQTNSAAASVAEISGNHLGSLATNKVDPEPPRFPSILDDNTQNSVALGEPRVTCQMDDQDAVFPPTTEFGRLSITQTSKAVPLSGTQNFPIINYQADFPGVPGYVTTQRRGGRFGVNEENPFKEEEVHQSDVDPTTIFIGGLDVCGENLWSEARLRSIFEKYGEIVGIQLVRPIAKRSAFAFLRYSNGAAAVRAVDSEHNQVYDSRRIRVQLRDNNPPRSPWRMNRGRGGRVPRHYPEPRRGTFGDTYSDDHSVHRRDLGHQDEIQRARSEQDHHVNASARSGPQGGFNRNNFAHPSQPNNEPSVGHQHYGGPRTHSTSASSISPPPSAAGSQPGVSAPISHHPGVGYFSHQPWMYPYPGYPYAFPYIPSYPGVPNSHPNPLLPGQSETPPNAPQHAAQAGSTSSEHLQFPPQQTLQPPLRPTGFIQGGNGVFVPVYQPEALDQYMSHTRRDQNSPSQASQQTQPPHGWQPYAPVAPYPYIFHPSMMQSAPVPPQQHAPHPNAYLFPPGGAPWGHNPMPMVPPQVHQNTPPPYLLPPAASNSSIGSSGSRRHISASGTNHSHQTFSQNEALNSPRRTQRRDSQPSQTGISHNSSWSSNQQPQRRNSDLDGRVPLSQAHSHSGIYSRANGPSVRY